LFHVACHADDGHPSGRPGVARPNSSSTADKQKMEIFIRVPFGDTLLRPRCARTDDKARNNTPSRIGDRQLEPVRFADKSGLSLKF
jgi:hypothetical protein